MSTLDNEKKYIVVEPFYGCYEGPGWEPDKEGDGYFLAPAGFEFSSSHPFHKEWEVMIDELIECGSIEEVL